MKTNNKNGISLIVLVITIVVMIILATVIILSLSGSGIIDNAKDARDRSDEANLKDAAIIAYSEWNTAVALGKKQIENITLTENPMDYVEAVLLDAGYTDADIQKVNIDTAKGIIKIEKTITFYIEDGEGTRTSYTVDAGTTWDEFAKMEEYAVQFDYINFEQAKSGFYHVSNKSEYRSEFS